MSPEMMALSKKGKLGSGLGFRGMGAAFHPCELGSVLVCVVGGAVPCLAPTHDLTAASLLSSDTFRSQGKLAPFYLLLKLIVCSPKQSS